VETSPDCDAQRIYCVVVNYRNWKDTIQCVRALQRQQHSLSGIVVVDNFSQNESVHKLKQSLPEVAIVENNRNAGYADGCNVGIQYVHQLGVEFAWIVTPDVIVQPDTLQRLIAAMDADPKLGVCGPVLNVQNGFIVESKLHESKGFFPEHVFYSELPGDLPELICSDYVDGCCILLRIEMLHQIGLMRTEFFLYFEETELCLRARRAGWQVAILSRTTVSTRAMNEERNGREFFMVRNSIFLARLSGGGVLRTCLRHLYNLAFCVATGLGRSSRNKIMPMIRGLFAGVKLRIGNCPVLTEPDQNFRSDSSV
jgi:GT2 family glycosyltransferase